MPRFEGYKAYINGTIPTLLKGNELENRSLQVIKLVFATYSLRASMIVLLFICTVVIYHVLLLVIKDLWKAHREVAASLGLDRCESRIYKERVEECFRRCCVFNRNTADNI